MSKNDKNFVYFSAIDGHVVPRYGSDGFISAKRVKGIGFVIDTVRVVRIPAETYRIFKRQYDRAVRSKSLIQKTESEYLEYIEKRNASASKATKKTKAKKGERGDQSSAGGDK